MYYTVHFERQEEVFDTFSSWNTKDRIEKAFKNECLSEVSRETSWLFSFWWVYCSKPIRCLIEMQRWECKVFCHWTPLKKHMKIAWPRCSRINAIFLPFSSIVKLHTLFFFRGLGADLDTIFGKLKSARNIQKGIMGNIWG